MQQTWHSSSHVRARRSPNHRPARLQLTSNFARTPNVHVKGRMPSDTRCCWRACSRPVPRPPPAHHREGGIPGEAGRPVADPDSRRKLLLLGRSAPNASLLDAAVGGLPLPSGPSLEPPPAPLPVRLNGRPPPSPPHDTRCVGGSWLPGPEGGGPETIPVRAMAMASTSSRWLDPAMTARSPRSARRLRSLALTCRTRSRCVATVRCCEASSSPVNVAAEAEVAGRQSSKFGCVHDGWMCGNAKWSKNMAGRKSKRPFRRPGVRIENCKLYRTLTRQSKGKLTLRLLWRLGR